MSGVNGWKYYNHAAIPTGAPHEQPDLLPVENGALWKAYPRALFARWTTDYDCAEKTNWWYVIKDEPLDVASLKYKRRYEIKKGNKFFEVKRIRPSEYGDEMFRVEAAAYSGWSEKYRPKSDRDRFDRGLASWDRYRVYGGFSREDGSLCSFALVDVGDRCAAFTVLKSIPACESRAINAAMVCGILEDLASFLAEGGYICDGGRSINHETAFQDYLEKYFGFRKAYCKLNLRFRPGMGIVVGCLYPFRRVLKKLDSNGLVHQINGLLTMVELAK